jgi:hypothetical protein
MNRPRAGRLFGPAATALLLATATILAQTPALRQLPYENLRADMQGVRVTVTYDLVSADPVNEVFNVSLQVKIKSTGQLVAVAPANLSGDGLGPRLSAGRQKKIVWNAGRDLEAPQFELYEFSLVVVSLTGQMSVETTPAGATVKIDDEPQPRGVTPLTIDGLKPGLHTVVVAKDGYVESRGQELIEAEKITRVTRGLAVVPPPPKGSTVGPGGTVIPPKKGGLPKWLIPAAGGGAAAAFLGLKGKGTTITPPVDPGTGGGTTSCTFSLSSGSFDNPLQSGGAKLVSVGVSPSTCSPQTWTASVDANSPFVHLSQLSGTGNQTVTVTVDANPPELGVVSRNGSATIAGLGFQVAGQTNQVITPATTQASEQSGSATFAALPGITVVAGQRLTITASGFIIVAGVAGGVQPGGSNTGNGGSQARLPGAPKHGLVCGINGQTTTVDLFFVGTSFTATSALATGPLFCGMNAPDLAGFTGNSGSWTLTVTVGG